MLVTNKHPGHFRQNNCRKYKRKIRTELQYHAILCAAAITAVCIECRTLTGKSVDCVQEARIMLLLASRIYLAAGIVAIISPETIRTNLTPVFWTDIDTVIARTADPHRSDEGLNLPH